MGKEITAGEIYQSFSDRYLELILFPTEQCNFRCTYCYEDFKLGKMSVDVRNGVKNLISSRVRDLDHLRISWFGGEPLAAKTVIYEIMEFAQEIAVKKGVNCSVKGNMTTNGYLLSPDVFERLNKLKVDAFQVSIDGIEEVHNRTRVKMSGNGTFNKIWKNLCSIQETELNFDILIRLHYHPGNINDMKAIIDKIAQQFGHDKRFRANLQPIQHKGGENDDSFSVFSWKEMNEIEKELEVLLLEKGDVENYHAPKMCYAARANSFAIRSDGRLAKCTVAVHDDINSIGKINPDGTLDIDGGKMKHWISGVENLDRDFALCPYSKLKTNEQKINLDF